MATIALTDGATATGILGLGVYRPDRVVDNEEICQVLDSTDEWIQSRSGIRTRRYAGEGESLLDMGERAARDALASAGVSADQVGTVIVATSTHTQHTPAAAPQIAHRLGSTAASFDLVAGCAGFCHGLAVASDLVRGGSSAYVLVIGVEKLSTFLDPTDRSTAFIFGDGAGAVVVGAADEAGIGPVAWGSDGAQSDVIIQTPRCEHIDEDHPPVVQMQGQAVFRWAPFAMADVAREAVKSAGLSLGELDVFVPHQANLRITQLLTKNLGLGEDVAVATDIVDSGNTSAASVPLAMERMLREGTAQPGDLALLIAFGAGLSFAGQVVRVPALG